MPGVRSRRLNLYVAPSVDGPPVAVPYGMRQERSWGNIKPPTGTAIDWAHPLSNSLRYLHLFNESIHSNELSEETGYMSAKSTIVGTPDRTFGPYGRSITTSVGNYVTSVAGPLRGELSLTSATIVALCKIAPGNTNGYAGIVNFRAPSISASFSMILNPGNANNQVLGMDWSASGLYDHIVGPTIDNTWGLAAVTVGPNKVSWYFHGVYREEAFGVSAFTLPSTTIIGSDTYQPELRTINATFAMVALYTRALSKTELDWLASEPYAMLKSPSSRLWST